MTGKNNVLGLYQTEVQTYVSFTSFMTAVVVFFTGLILTQFKSFDILIKVPVTFLIVSIFGFLYSTLIYTNAACDVREGKLEKANKHILFGDILSEYLGIYLLVFSIPLVINVLTTDTFLRMVTLLSSIGGFAVYQFSHFSVLERHFKNDHKKLSSLIILLGFLLFTSQIYAFYFVEISMLFIVFILGITYFATETKLFAKHKANRKYSSRQ